ncbi:MAG: alanine--glyoxylate aminotransferase family protein [Candidatus Omnitrophica bacterium]|nr:alanine--glyoxylate aminotransferase family protein [Candidatus Omnitrophota bacterium]
MKKYLLTPGPTPIPAEVAESMAKPIIHHRTKQYRDIFQTVNDKLKSAFKTENNVLTFASSGTGAMEASVCNSLSKGDSVIVIRGGKFGERFAEICEAYGVNVLPFDIEWGTRPEAPALEEILKENRKVKAVFTQLCETSTATVYDIKSIAGVVNKTGAILVVDVISGLGSDEFDMDGWGVDIAIGGSQKGLMLPPGLSFCAVSKKAWDMVKKSTLPRYYYDFAKYDKLIEKSDNPFTPAITLVVGLEKALSIITQNGVDNFVAGHRKDASYVRDYIAGLGLSLFSRFPSDAVTAVNVPESVDGAKLIDSLKTNGITFAGGQGHLKGKIFRIAHMGGISREDLQFALGKLKETLEELTSNKQG